MRAGERRRQHLSSALRGTSETPSGLGHRPSPCGSSGPGRSRGNRGSRSRPRRSRPLRPPAMRRPLLACSCLPSAMNGSGWRECRALMEPIGHSYGPNAPGLSRRPAGPVSSRSPTAAGNAESRSGLPPRPPALLEPHAVAGGQKPIRFPDCGQVRGKNPVEHGTWLLGRAPVVPGTCCLGIEEVADPPQEVEGYDDDSNDKSQA